LNTTERLKWEKIFKVTLFLYNNFSKLPPTGRCLYYIKMRCSIVSGIINFVPSAKRQLDSNPWSCDQQLSALPIALPLLTGKSYFIIAKRIIIFASFCRKYFLLKLVSLTSRTMKLSSHVKSIQSFFHSFIAMETVNTCSLRFLVKFYR